MNRLCQIACVMAFGACIVACGSGSPTTPKETSFAAWKDVVEGYSKNEDEAKKRFEGRMTITEGTIHVGDVARRKDGPHTLSPQGKPTIYLKCIGADVGADFDKSDLEAIKKLREGQKVRVSGTIDMVHKSNGEMVIVLTKCSFVE